MAGRRPKPTVLKQLAGNPGRRKLNENEPKPGKSSLKCPEALEGDAQAEWERLAPALDRIGLLSEIDTTALMGYCVSFARWLDAERHVKSEGAIVVAPKSGFPVANPWIAIGNRALENVRKFLIEFGGTPASRSKVHAVPEVDATDEFFAFLATGQKAEARGN